MLNHDKIINQKEKESLKRKLFHRVLQAKDLSISMQEAVSHF